MNWIPIVNYILLLATVYSAADFYITETKPSNYEEYRKAMVEYYHNHTDFYFFDERQFDPFVIKSEENSPCQWITKVETPYSMTNGFLTYLIVQIEELKQKIQTTRCVMESKKKNESCGDIIGLEQFNMTMECTHSYEKLPFYIYDTALKEIRHYYANVPICCFCDVVDL